jgi:lipopolysaccharide transport system permease protein
MIRLMLWFWFLPDWRIAVPPGLHRNRVIAAAFGPAMLLASLNVRYRDFRFVVPFVIQFGLYVSPVGLLSSVVRSSGGCSTA